jgi:hypothetical protein
MNTAAPIELNFYNENDEIVATHRRSRIPSYLLDTAINLQSELVVDGEEAKPNTDALFDFVVEFYGGKFTRDELKKQSDLIECMSVLRSVIARASDLTREFAKANPPGPSPKRK